MHSRPALATALFVPREASSRTVAMTPSSRRRGPTGSSYPCLHSLWSSSLCLQMNSKRFSLSHKATERSEPEASEACHFRSLKAANGQYLLVLDSVPSSFLLLQTLRPISWCERKLWGRRDLHFFAALSLLRDGGRRAISYLRASRAERL